MEKFQQPIKSKTMNHILKKFFFLPFSLAIILIVASPLVSRTNPADSIPSEELVGVWTFTQNGFDHNFTKDRVLELCKTVISVHYPDHHFGIHIRLKFLDQEVGGNVHTLEPCTFADNVESCRVESEESKDGKRTLTLYKKVRDNVYDVSSLKPDRETVSKQQTIYACPVEILDVPKWIENDMESKFVAKKTVKEGMFRKLVDGIWGWYGVLFERKVKGKGRWQVIGYEKKNPRYSGEIKNGQPDGRGIITFPDGDKYEGELKNGRLSGQGTYTFKNGMKYVGQWKDSEMNGQGTKTWSNGDKYVGQWKGSKRNGKGTQTWSDGNKYEGEWKSGKKHGQGTYTWSDGDKYVGQLKDGVFSGQGTYSFSNGMKYVGKFRNAKYNGQGILTLSDGRKVIGEFRKDKPWNVKLFFKNGSIQAKWVNGKKQ
jgi:hypothetical protein